MYSMYTCTPSFMLGGLYAQSELQTVNAVRERQHKFHPYRSLTGPFNKTGPHKTSVSEYQFPGHQTHQTHKTLGFQQQDGYDRHPAPYGLLGIDFPYQNASYLYPTLNFLLPSNDTGNKKHTETSIPPTEINDQKDLVCKQTKTNNDLNQFYGRNPLGVQHSTETRIPLPGDYEQQDRVYKQTQRTDDLHPFYRRQLTMASPRDGLTRTRDKYRVVYTEKQKTLLEEEYQKNNFLPEVRRADLVKETELSERQIKFWFQNRRAKDKRDKKAKIASRTSRNIESTTTQLETTSKTKVRVQETTEDTELKISENTSCKHAQQTFGTNENMSSPQQTACTTDSMSLPMSEYIQKHQQTPGGDTRESQTIPECRHFRRNLVRQTPTTTNLTTPPISKGLQKKQQTSGLDPIIPKTMEEYRYWSPMFENQLVSPTTGSCRFENIAGYSKTNSPSPTGSQFQYPVSPSEWISTNQKTYLFDRVEMSPLFNGLHESYGFRL